MSTTFSLRTGLVAAAALAAAAGAGRAQTLASRIAAVGSGTAHVSFTARPGVCGNGNSISTRSGRSREWESDCEEGPVRLSLDLDGGRVTELRTYVGGHWAAGGDARDLGQVAAPQAAAYLLDLARTGSGEVAKKAVFTATLADSVTVWPDLLRLARDENRPLDVRKSATFWLSQAASDAVTPALGQLAADETVDEQVRKQAIFALSQRPNGEGVQPLIDVARGNKDPLLRRQAIFWLGQSNDPRALALFEELLTKR